MLKSGKVCRVAPIPGETKVCAVLSCVLGILKNSHCPLQVWQYINLTHRIYLINCPGIIPTSAHDTTSPVLKGVIRVEALSTPSEHIPELMQRVKPLYLSRTYGIPLPDKNDASVGWDPEMFLDQLARMKGWLLKGGEPYVDTLAKIVLSD